MKCEKCSKVVTEMRVHKTEIFRGTGTLELVRNNAGLCTHMKYGKEDTSHTDSTYTYTCPHCGFELFTEQNVESSARAKKMLLDEPRAVKKAIEHHDKMVEKAVAQLQRDIDAAQKRIDSLRRNAQKAEAEYLEMLPKKGGQ